MDWQRVGDMLMGAMAPTVCAVLFWWRSRDERRAYDLEKRLRDSAFAYLSEERLLHADCPRCGPAFRAMVADRAARGG